MSLPISRSTAEALEAAIQSHLLLRGRLRQAVQTGRAGISPEEASAQGGCDLDRLLGGGDLAAAARGARHVREIARSHAEFHACAGRILRLVADRRVGTAECALGVELRDISNRMIAEIEALQDELKAPTGA
ncbi:CZB domain-containing protein [Rhodovulum visakhapatnamense]|uniref:DUF2383 domain-containing protein n=1 Tax=Rhodovulum visakhapatnamense TaxID=364297 RepID=A0A4R8G9Y5_9RHOB|nr:CZB domain-containing protein [Rhodovulum visakhapatnamense]TDX33206.1 hypothetical protein EV657_10281 [Rhodovulum visakhapatnamense]